MASRKQQDLSESAGRNVEERIKAIQEGGDGYMTVISKEETESVIAKIKQDAKRYRAKREVEAERHNNEIL